jgi:hypothetical protein
VGRETEQLREWERLTWGDPDKPPMLCRRVWSQKSPPSRLWMDSRMVLTSYRADHLSLRMSKQMLPWVSTLG